MLRDWLLHPLTTLRQHRLRRKSEQLARLRARYQVFRTLLDDNHRAVELITELGGALRSAVLWPGALSGATAELLEVTADLVEKLERLTGGRSAALTQRQSLLAAAIRKNLAGLPQAERLPICLDLDEVTPAMLRAVGGKGATLARLRRTSMFTVPDGFVLPVTVCRLFLDQENLYMRLVARLRTGEKSEDGLPGQDAVAEVRQLILATPLPRDLRAALAGAATPFFRAGKGLAVRSSAVGEDTLSHSFAGQYLSVLNVVSLPQLEEAFKQVVASAFNMRNLAYRRHGGLAPYEFDLAVLCLEMVEARAAGILFTVNPNFAASGRMLISAVHGLGELAVAGSEAADVYQPPRDGSGPGERQVAQKSRRLISSGTGGVVEEVLDRQSCAEPVLSTAEVLVLTRLGLAVEEWQGGPQDIEWAVDHQGKVVLLQSRPLKVAAGHSRGEKSAPGRKQILSGGLVGAPGLGGGQVRLVRSRHDLEALTDPPYVLVMHQSLVEAVGALRQAGGVLVDLGNPADHLSCVAREYEIPMLTGLGRATLELTDNAAVLVDCERGAVFYATDEEMTRSRENHRRKNISWQERIAKPREPVAAALYDKIVPLNLTDAYGATFTIAECRTLHDLVRYAHEKAVLAMFEAGDEAVEQASGVTVHLESEVPFHLSIIDLGGGLLSANGRWAKPEQVLSRPFQALWQGVVTPGINWGPMAGGVAVGSIMSRFLTDHRSARPIGLPNYALVTRDFLNLNARMDFHFTMVDAICGLNARLNYIKFRFKGGGTGLAQRCRRVRCLAEIMTATGFFCDLREDLLTASIQGGTAEVLEEKLRVVGRLLGFSRLLDAAMHSDGLVAKVARAFLDGDYRLETLADELLAAGQATQA